MGKETSDSSIFIIIFTVIAFIILQKYLTELFITIWRVPMIGFMYPLIYLPKGITEHGLFFWASGIPETAQNYIEILMKSPEYIYNKYYEKGIIGAVNVFVTTLIVPYLCPLFINYFVKINKLRNNTFRDKMTIDKLIETQCELWPQIKPIVGIHPELIDDLSEGPWASSVDPYDFAEKNGLIIKYMNKTGTERLKLDYEKTRTVFLQQFNKIWTGVDDLTQEEKFILAIFAPKICRKPKESEEVMQTVARSYTTEKKYSKKQIENMRQVAIELADEIIDKYVYTDIVQKFINQHYYVDTVFARLLKEARFDGVLATSDFIWLKPRNRVLYYLLNNVGRKVAWSENAALWYHYNYELMIERKIPYPMVEGAIISLDKKFSASSEIYDPMPRYINN